MFTKTCEVCKKVFMSRGTKGKYCSRACCYESQKGQNLTTIICEICNKPFKVRQYRKDTARFCGKKCGGKWHAENRLSIIRKPFPLGNKLGKGKIPKNSFTSAQVKGENNSNWKEGIEFICEGCNKSFRVKSWLVRQNGKYKYCSRACRPTGDKHPLWVGGNTTYRGRGWLEIREKVIERDNGTCRDCGKYIGKSIPVHHILPFRKFKNHEDANSLDNLMCLCQSCHMKKERKIKS